MKLMKRSRLAAASALVLTSGLLVACGDDDEVAPAPDDSPAETETDENGDEAPTDDDGGAMEEPPTDDEGGLGGETDTDTDSDTDADGGEPAEGDLTMDNFDATLPDGWQEMTQESDEFYTVGDMETGENVTLYLVPDAMGIDNVDDYAEALENTAGMNDPSVVSETIEVNGQTLEGIEATNDVEGQELTQRLYPYFNSDGTVMEIALTAFGGEITPELLDDFEEFTSSITTN